jgi:hypothetical protein
MSGSRPRPRWLFLFQPKWLGWHLFAFGAVFGMLWLGDWQFHRALSGNGLSWAYTFEWPIFAIFGLVFWAKTIYDEFRPPQQSERAYDEVDLPDGAGLPLATSGDGVVAVRAEDDPELAAYNAYLAKLNDAVQGRGGR